MWTEMPWERADRREVSIGGLVRFGVWMKMFERALERRVSRKVFSGVGGGAAPEKKCGFLWCGEGMRIV